MYGQPASEPAHAAVPYIRAPSQFPLVLLCHREEWFCRSFLYPQDVLNFIIVNESKLRRVKVTPRLPLIEASVRPQCLSNHQTAAR